MSARKRGTFASRFGVIAAVGGSVVGLGNIWRFPYIAGENGGAAFILVYLCISFLVAVPIMLSEFTIGRTTKRNAMRAFRKLAPHTPWQGVGYLGILTAFVILSFYCVIAGWALEFFKESLFNQFAGKTTAEISARFNAFVGSGWRPAIWNLVFIAATTGIVISGVEKGIERYNKILMPLLVLLLVGLAVNAATLEGARKGIEFLFRPDFSKITWNTLLQALGQSFFSLSLGMGAMITYGSYIRKNENMFRVAYSVATTDVVVAILSGLAIFPAVFSFGISPTSGPELIFITLPNVFTRMFGGYFVSILFFILVFLAAITSTVSLFEVVTVYLSEEMRISRRKAVLMVSGSVVVTSTLCLVSQMPGSGLTVAGYNLFDLSDKLSSNVMLPLGGFFIVLFAGWFMAPARFRDELTNGGTCGRRMYPVVRLMIKYICPVVIFLLFLSLVGII